MLEKSMNQEPNSINQEFPVKKKSSYDNNIIDLSGRGCQWISILEIESKYNSENNKGNS